MGNRDDILIGSGELYFTEYTGGDIPSHTEIETPENNVGHCQGGFTIDYKPDAYEIRNQYDKIVKTVIRSEDISCKTGILTWDLERLKYFSLGEYSEDPDKGTRKLTFGGQGHGLKTVLVRFVHTKEDGKKIRFTMIGQGGNGFALDFANKETVIDAEITAIDKKENYLAEIEEEVEKQIP